MNKLTEVMVALALAVPAFAGTKAQGKAQTAKAVGKPAPFHLVVNPPNVAPDFALRDSRGKTIRLSDYRGKVVLVDFWATWCGGCTTEVPWYIEFQKKYARKGFTAIGVSMDMGWKEVRPFMAKEGMNYPVVIGSMDLLQKYGDNGAMPATFLVAPDGRIAAYKVGMVDRAGFERRIRAMLGQESRASAD
jgi:peroxiredoxin